MALDTVKWMARLLAFNIALWACKPGLDQHETYLVIANLKPALPVVAAFLLGCFRPLLGGVAFLAVVFTATVWPRHVLLFWPEIAAFVGCLFILQWVLKLRQDRQYARADKLLAADPPSAGVSAALELRAVTSRAGKWDEACEELATRAACLLSAEGLPAWKVARVLERVGVSSRGARQLLRKARSTAATDEGAQS
jgi:hypothetical protein